MASNLPPSRTVKLTALGSKESIISGRFNVSRYTGTFQSQQLQTRANLGYWYARAMGTGCDLTGEGSTPVGAIADLKKRAAELRDEIIRVYSL